jgi:hypothetical protein
LAGGIQPLKLPENQTLTNRLKPTGIWGSRYPTTGCISKIHFRSVNIQNTLKFERNEHENVNYRIHRSSVAELRWSEPKRKSQFIQAHRRTSQVGEQTHPRGQPSPQEGGFAALLKDKHISQFLNKHFVIETQVADADIGCYLIYNQQRELVHRVADEKYPYELAVKIKRGLDDQTQYYTLLSRFESGDRSTDLLANLIIGATDAADSVNAPRFLQAYLETLPTPPTDADLRFIMRHTTRSSDPGFHLLLDRPIDVEKLAAIIFHETFTPYLNDKDVNVALLAGQTKAKYPIPALARHIDRMPIEFLEMREDWDELGTYLHTNNLQLSPAQLEYYNGLLKAHDAKM